MPAVSRGSHEHLPHKRHASTARPHATAAAAARRDAPRTQVWTETKEHAAARAAHMASDLKNVTRKWEEGNKVLGHVQKTNVARPRALLTVGDATSARDVDQKMPFTSNMWVARRACDSGSQALLELLEVRALGHATPNN